MAASRREVLVSALAALSLPAIAQADAPTDPAVPPLSSAAEAEALAWVKAAAHPFAADPDAEDLSTVAQALAGARVIGVGEASHGGHEDRVFKAALVRALVERGQVRVLALECNHQPGLALDRYVQTGVGDPAELMRANGFFEIWRCEEMLSLITWARAWNLAGKPRLRVVGVDCQDTGRDADFALTWLKAHDPRQAAALRKRLGLVTTPQMQATRLYDVAASLTAAQMREQIAAAKALAEVFQARPAWSRLPGYADAAHAARAAHQGLLSFELETKGAPPTDDAVYYTRRDHFMADNIVALAADEGAAYWAHNHHVMPAMGVWGPGESCGGYLRAAIGEAYRCVVFECDEGVIFAKPFGQGARSPGPSVPLQRMQRPSVPATLAAHLAPLGLERFWLDLRAAPANAAVKTWLAQPYLHDWQGFAVLDGPLDPQTAVAVGGRVDILVFLRRISPSRLLPFVKTL